MAKITYPSAIAVWKMIGAISGLAGVGLALGLSDQVFAQIIPDGTLGVQGSLVTPDVNINGGLADRIDGGATRGANLFHSFEQFNIGDGQRVYFANPAAIENIFSRVTGTDPSDILGTLGVNGGANLFLLNPNGIIFGENATLDVRGSFVATTANGIEFGNQGFFSASEPEVSPLLTVNPSALFFNQINAGRIENRSIAPAGLDPIGFPLFGLRVPDGRSLLLVGGDITIDRGRVNALGGRVELAGVSGSGTVGLNIDGNNLSLSVPETLARADVSLKNNAVLYVLADNGGSIAINAQNIDILGNSSVRAGIRPGLGILGNQAGDITLNGKGAITVEGSYILNFVGSEAIGNGGDITIIANSLSLTNFSLVSNDSFGRGNAGKALIQVAEAALLTQSSTIYNRVFGGIGNGGGITFIAGSASFLEGAELVANNTNAEGNVGNITVQVRDQISFDGLDGEGFASGIFNVVRPGGRGNAGNIILTAGSLSLTNGGRLQSNTRGQGDAGNIIIDVRDHILLDGIDSSLKNRTPSGVYTTVGTDGVGEGGDIFVTAGSLSATNGAQLTATTFEQGDAGNITIHVRDRASFDGISIDEDNSSGVFSAVAPGSVGQGGDILVTAESLFLSNGALLSAVTLGNGNAGKVTVATDEVVSLDGLGSDGTRSGISTAVLVPEAMGNANDIDIKTGLLSVTNGAQLSASTVGEGKAGNIRVMANSLQVINGGQLRTITQGEGDARNINLLVQDRITLAGTNSGLFANTTEISSGNGGSIFIDNPRTVLIQDEAQIAVDSQGLGTGGNIEIFADSLTLDNQASLSAETASNTGGNITLSLEDLLLMRRESRISTTAGIAQASGDGGNITIDAGVIAAVPDDNNDITANAFSGRGGRVTLTTQGLYNFVIRSREQIQALLGTDDLSEFDTSQLQTNDITAISQTSPTLSRIPTLNLQGIDPTGGLIELPDLVDVTRLVEQNLCAASVGSEFTITGRGGLPTPPHEPLIAEATWEDWRIDSESESNEAIPSSPVSRDSQRTTEKRPKAIVEAQGWYRDAQGNVILTANPTTVTPHGTWLSSYKCQ